MENSEFRDPCMLGSLGTGACVTFEAAPIAVRQRKAKVNSAISYDNHVRRWVKPCHVDLELMLIYPARLLESNLQGGDLNSTVLLYHI